MASRREEIEAEDFERRRAVAALYRGDTLEVDEVPARPVGPVIAGLLLVVLLCAGAAAVAFLGGRTPSGWLADGTLVVDKQSGARFVAEGGALRPAPTVTAALLAGARPTPLLVASERVAAAPHGLPLPGAGLPETPPRLPAVPTGFTACATGPVRLDVFSGEPGAIGPAPGALLVRAVGSPQLVLVTGRRAFRVSADATTALGYSLAQVREVSAAWLALVPPGPDLGLLRPDTGAGGGVPGVGAGGEVVASADSGRHFLVAGGTVRPLANRTSEVLAPSPARTLPDSLLLAAPAGPPAGIVDAPSAPPPVPAREALAVPCVRSSDGLVSVAAAVVDAGTRPSPVHVPLVRGLPVAATWHFPPDQGALVGPPDLDRPRPAGSVGGGLEGVQVISEGVGYPVADAEALRALGYRRDQVVLLPTPWTDLLDRGGTLRRPA